MSLKMRAEGLSTTAKKLQDSAKDLERAADRLEALGEHRLAGQLRAKADWFLGRDFTEDDLNGE